MRSASPTSSCEACVLFTQAEQVGAEADQYLIGRGLPDLKQAVTDQWTYKGSSYCQKWPLAPALTPIGADLKPVTATPRVVFHLEGRTHVTLSSSPAGPTGMTSQYVWCRLGRRCLAHA
ncbi:unnamed protein product, partial [Iphiclides podalirius]